MDRVKLLQNPLPIDRVAVRVTRKAKPEHVWMPKPKEQHGAPPVGAVLRTAQIPPKALAANPHLSQVIGKRRDRMVVIGYAADQKGGGEKSRWVVRCDCGNFEHRVKVIRWLGTEAKDMCRECRNRVYKLRGEWNSREPAKRATAL